MRTLALVAVITSLLAVVACRSPDEYRASNQVTATYQTTQIIYTIDRRVGICYSWTAPGTQAATRSTVSCTDEVMALIGPPVNQPLPEPQK